MERIVFRLVLNALLSQFYHHTAARDTFRYDIHTRGYPDTIEIGIIERLFAILIREHSRPTTSHISSDAHRFGLIPRERERLRIGTTTTFTASCFVEDDRTLVLLWRRFYTFLQCDSAACCGWLCSIVSFVLASL